MPDTEDVNQVVEDVSDTQVDDDCEGEADVESQSRERYSMHEGITRGATNKPSDDGGLLGFARDMTNYKR